MEMNVFPQTSDVIEGLRYKGYVGPSEDITEKIFKSVLAAEKLTGVPILRRRVTEDSYVKAGWIYVAGFNISDFCIPNSYLEIEEIKNDLGAVQVIDHSVRPMSILLGTHYRSPVTVKYEVGFLNRELPALYQEIIINLIYYNVLPTAYRNEEVESEINRLLEVSEALKGRLRRNRFTHMMEQGII